VITLASFAAVAAVLAACLAAGLRDPRAIAVALAVAMAALPFTGAALPGPLPAAARIAGALLAADLLWVGTRVRRVGSAGSPAGLAAQPALAAAAFVVGLQLRPVAPLPGPAVEQAAGFALVALAVLPLADREPLRVGLGAALLTLGLSLLREAWLGPAPALEDLVLAVLLVAILGATGLFAADVPEPAAGTVAAGAGGPVVAGTARTGGPGADGALSAERRALRPGDQAAPLTDATAALWGPGGPLPRPYAGAHPDVRRTRRPRDPGNRP
jgi:hypothetical protein